MNALQKGYSCSLTNKSAIRLKDLSDVSFNKATILVA